MNGVSGTIYITKLDVLDGVEAVKICVGYAIDGTLSDILPVGAEELERCHAQYEELSGLAREHGRRAKVHKAHYVLMNIECDNETLTELEHSFKFSDAVLRHLIVKMTKAVDGSLPDDEGGEVEVDDGARRRRRGRPRRRRRPPAAGCLNQGRDRADS